MLVFDTHIFLKERCVILVEYFEEKKNSSILHYLKFQKKNEFFWKLVYGLQRLILVLNKDSHFNFVYVQYVMFVYSTRQKC